MRAHTVRLHEHTFLHVTKAAKKAGVSPAALIRRTLEQTFDGTPHNPLGVVARPGFYDDLCQALAYMCASSDLSSNKIKELVKLKARDIRRELEIDFEHTNL